MTSREGSRGGPVPALTADEAVKLLERWRGEEMGWVRARIIQTARLRGEYHADDLSDVQLSQPNVIGAGVRSLLTTGLIEPTGERRRNAGAASHGRRSDVYSLTHRGWTLANALKDAVGDRMPAPKAPDPPPSSTIDGEQSTLFDLPDSPAAPLERTSPYA